MNILMVSPYDFAVPGGVNQHISALTREMQRAGHSAEILAPSSSENGENDGLIPVSGNIITLDFAGSRAGISLSPLMYGRVKKLLQARDYDVIHLHEPLAPALPLVVLRHAPLTPRSIRVATFHAYRRRPVPGTGNSLFQGYLRRLDGLVAVSDSARSYHQSYFPGDYRVIPNGVDVGRFSQAEPYPALRDGRPTILFVGRLDSRKGFEHLLEALPTVKSALPEIRLLVVGAFDSEDCEPFERAALQAGVASQVVFVGRVQDDALARYYRSADVFCAPATGFESFGLVLLEAMAAGCPVVASNIPGYRSVLTHGREGLAVAPGDRDALARAIIEVLQDPGLGRRLAAAGRLTATRHAWDRISREILEFYSQCHLHIRRERSMAAQNGKAGGSGSPRRILSGSQPPPA